MWKINPASGAITKISSAPGFWEIADDTAAWGTDFAGTVMRMNLATGVSKAVYTSPSKHVDVAGFVGGRVLVFEWNEPSVNFAFSVIGPDGSAEPVAVPSAMQNMIISGYFQDGSTVLIFGHGFGLAAFDTGHGLEVLTTTPEIGVMFGRCMPA